MIDHNYYKKQENNLNLYNPYNYNLETKHNRPKSCKGVENVYKNPFPTKNQISSRLKVTHSRSRKFSMDEFLSSDEILELKQTINKQKNELTQIKTQLQYTQSELDRTQKTEDTEVARLHKKILFQKNTIESLKQDLKKKDQVLEETKKKSKYCQINELETQINILNEECKKMVKIIESLSDTRQKDEVDVQEQDIQKSVLISHLKKEKEKYLELIDEKNSEVIRWRDRVIQLEKNQEKILADNKTKKKQKLQALKAEVKKLKVQLEGCRSKYKGQIVSLKEEITKLQTKAADNKASPKVKGTPKAPNPDESVLNPVPMVIEVIDNHLLKEKITLDVFFHKMIISCSSVPSINDMVSALNAHDEQIYAIEELYKYFNTTSLVSITQLKDFYNEVHQTPIEIQKVLQNISLRLQLKKIPREKVLNVFAIPDKDIKNSELFIEMLCTSPISLKRDEAKALFGYLFPRSLSIESIYLSIPIRLGNWNIISEPNEKYYKKILSTLIHQNHQSLLKHCEDLDLNKTGTLTHIEFFESFKKASLKLEKGLENYIVIQSYSQTYQLNTVRYPDFIKEFIQNKVSEKYQVKDLTIDISSDTEKVSENSVFLLSP